MKLQFEKINLIDLIVVVGLIAGMIYSLFKGEADIAMNIASGFAGYISAIGKSAITISSDNEDAEA